MHIASSASGHAVALTKVDSKAFIGSVAIGPDTARLTFADGTKQLVSMKPKLHRGAYQIGGHKFRLTTLKNGKRALIGQSAYGAIMIHSYSANALKVRAKSGQSAFLSFAANPDATPETSAQLLAGMTDEPGTWAGDDDFTGATTSTSSTLRATKFLVEPGGDAGDWGDAGDAGDSGDFSGDSGDSGDFSDTGDSNLTEGDCFDDNEALALAYIGLAGASAAEAAACVTPLVVIVIDCIGASVLLGVAAEALRLAKKQSQKDGCPTGP